MVTDGITEAADVSGAQFGETRVRDFLALVHAGEAAPLARLMSALRLFESGQPASDDVAVLLFAVTS